MMTLRSKLVNYISLSKYAKPQEEWANSLTHALGAGGALVGFFLLLFRPDVELRPFVGSLIFAGTMFFLYMASAFYHVIDRPFWKSLGRLVDHLNIYFLIAGTYTPIALFMGGRAGIGILIMIWSLAAIGSLLTIFFWGKFRVLHVIFYIVMGWSILFLWKPFTQSVDPAFIGFIAAGGVVYTVGTIFYALKKLPYSHAVWHLFVLGGSVCHFLGIYLFIK